MGPFALPVPNYRLGIHSHTNKRRKTNGEQNGEGDEPESDHEWDLPYSQITSGSINPRSHSPDTLHQLAVAGLDPEDEVPSVAHKLFPHKPLPPEGLQRKKRDGRNDVESTEDTIKQHSSDRLRHLSTLTAIVHRCLAEGDIPRAKRAFGLLLRTKDVDIRQAGFWAVGSEILMRDGETKGQQQQSSEQRLQDEGDRFAVGGNDETRNKQQRWGRTANIDRVRDYMETLIQQHPHDVHRPHLTSALDFWPALFGIEIYNVDAEFGSAMRRLRQQQKAEEEEEEDQMMDYEREDGDEDDDNKQQRQKAALAARDELRLETRGAADRVARRMDQTMEMAAFGAHRELLRLRGHLCLYVADLWLPSRLIDDEDEQEDEWEEDLSLKQIDDRLRKRAESADEYGALSKRREELEKAKGYFQKIVEGGGDVEDWVRRFVLAEEDKEGDTGYANDDGETW